MTFNYKQNLQHSDIEALLIQYQSSLSIPQKTKHILTLLRETPHEFFDMHSDIPTYHSFISELLKFSEFQCFLKSTEKANSEILIEICRDLFKDRNEENKINNDKAEQLDLKSIQVKIESEGERILKRLDSEMWQERKTKEMVEGKLSILELDVKRLQQVKATKRRRRFIKSVNIQICIQSAKIGEALKIKPSTECKECNLLFRKRSFVATDLLQIDKDQLTTHHCFDKIDEFMCYLYLIVEQNCELMQAGVLKVVKEVYK